MMTAQDSTPPVPLERRILITGARGQIGSDLVDGLRHRHGADSVLATDLTVDPAANGQGPFEVLDVLEAGRLRGLVSRYDIGAVYHLASLLSATGERKPDLAWRVNVEGLKHVLDAARRFNLKVFWPSSIAAFGPTTPRNNTPQHTILEPTTMYGVTKVSGELLCQYYHQRFDVDVRSIRYPGIISYKTKPSGGTTDYAVEIFHAALQEGQYTCFLKPDTRLPMMYIHDAIRATMGIMDVSSERLTVRTSYNLTAMSFSAQELVHEIQYHLPAFTCSFEPDHRQAIADSWPSTIDDRPARTDWDWNPAYSLQALVNDMLEQLAPQYATIP